MHSEDYGKMPVSLSISHTLVLRQNGFMYPRYFDSFQPNSCSFYHAVLQSAERDDATVSRLSVCLCP